jgi:hypothetical protein
MGPARYYSSTALDILNIKKFFGKNQGILSPRAFGARLPIREKPKVSPLWRSPAYLAGSLYPFPKGKIARFSNPFLTKILILFLIPFLVASLTLGSLEKIKIFPLVLGYFL